MTSSMNTAMAIQTIFRSSSSVPIFPRFYSTKLTHSRIPFPFPFPFSRQIYLSTLTSSSFSSSQPSHTTFATTNALDEVEIIQRIQSHQEKATRIPVVEEIRTVLGNSTRGSLSTFSYKYDGYPSGSMVDFACDADGSPILAVSSLAVHTKDLLANPKCSLLIAKDPEDRTDLVITVHGDAVTVTEGDIEAVRSMYLTKHPNAFWVQLHVCPKVVRYVSGVATALLGSGEFSGQEYGVAKMDLISQFSKPVATHMNKDHEEDTKLIVQHSTTIPVESAYMLDMDRLGFNVKVTYLGKTYKLRIPFPRPAVDRKDVKTLIVEMLQAAKSTSS